ncbi:hypothetical protein N7462_005236 [Penicillium macrosclerotiorum]|uniref:uncharacterized protein n=1 Tax=Penicillium macrosclerotiorum TaxID=303699 RepID=UPI0025474ADC|nr:uncharacterized protein N7462_005236 [Penicillium macrosclerotiorum]KAJ5690844.1 hypothetical protein N7462_005236 [Penicillium macrosclerotiorum]
MGIRTLFKSLRSSHGKGTPTSLSPSPSSSPLTVQTDEKDSISTAPSNHVQLGTCSSDIRVASDDHTPRDLWDEAYAILGREDSKLKEKYEEILLYQEGGNGDSTCNHLAPAGSYQREKQLREIATRKVEEVDLTHWKVNIGGKFVDVRDQFDKAVKIVVAAKDFVASAVSTEPHAALAWAGVSAAYEGLEAIPFAVRRLRVMERLIRQGNSGLTRETYQPDSIELVKDFEDTAVGLYKTILEFQIRFVRQHSNTWANRYGRDVLKADDWMSLTSRIKTLEAKCTELAQDLSREQIEKALHASEHNMQLGLQGIQQDLKKMTSDIEQQAIMQSTWRQTDEERKCVQLFRQSNPYENQKNRTSKRVLETGKWFLENDKFLDWRENEGPDLLWLSAKPGSGKSVLAKTIIDEGLATLSHQKQSAVCYFFFKDISPYQRKAISAISAILHQLFSALPSLVQHALMAYYLNGKELLHLFDEMFDILCKAAADPAVGQVVCILDALDECNDDDRFLLIETITKFYREAKDGSKINGRPKLKFLLTSRPYSHIHSQFHDLMKEAPTIHLSGDHESAKIKKEIDVVIDAKIPKLAAERGFDEQATKYLLKELHAVDNRTYLWLSLIMEEIRLSERPANKRELKKIISALPRSLIDAYDAILKRCRHPDLARQLLHIILAAREPLAVDDMKIATALANDFEYHSYEEIGIERSDAFEMRIKNVCGLFVTINNGSIFLIHQTAKEFLMKDDDMDQTSETWKHSFSRLDSETLLAKICITLLSFTHFSKFPLTINDDGDDDDNDDVDEPHKKISEYVKDNPFLGYAAMNWMNHCRVAELDNDQQWMPSMLSLCSANTPAFRTWYTIHQRSDENHAPLTTTSLNIAAQFDFPNVLASLLEHGEDPNKPDGRGRRPLRALAVELLLKANADINAYEWEEPWYDDVSDGGGSIEVKPFSGTPLAMAAVGGDLEMVKYLIERGAEINFPPHSSLTPLFAAFVMCVSNQAVSEEDEASYKEILQLLLRSGADVCFGVKDESYPIEISVLHSAARTRTDDLSFLQMLLDSETADVNFQLQKSSKYVRMENQDTAEDRWSINESESSSLEIRSSKANTTSASGRDPSGSSDDEDSRNSENDDNTSTPGHQRSDNDSHNDSDNDSDNDSRAGFSDAASQSDSSDSFDSLLNRQYVFGATPLHFAARSGLVENVQLLLEHGADPHIKNANGHTAMDFMRAELRKALQKNGYILSDGGAALPKATSDDD